MELTAVQWFDVGIIHVMLLGQLTFVVLWFRLPWWRQWVGRALMVKSVALGLLLLMVLVNFWITIVTEAEYPWQEWVEIGTHILVTVGIYSQILALVYEMRKGKQHHRAVQGTVSRGSKESSDV